jgi:hypothetical protein
MIPESWIYVDGKYKVRSIYGFLNMELSMLGLAKKPNILYIHTSLKSMFKSISAFVTRTRILHLVSSEL